ncbi:hypothetical protein L1787_02640 [Acuticoccus sp. M5D2P5]|uniref:hypothetical protein n=1 Tax=Acuticoccus kalidii TaxID=2910977 RepID=UPI001F194BBD|nr:hypothetical protein [Acuticoccus kalidii]MCF3932310.1 hypothetical protein [Acuticoccus kalidii]
MKPVFDRLTRLFDAAAEAGTPRRVWWRDDDAVREGPRLDAITALAAREAAPLTLAVIPNHAEPSIVRHCERHGHVMVQHGIAHENRERSGKSAELGGARDVADLVAACRAARTRLEGSPAFWPVMVPPWNRMREDLAAPLAQAGYLGLSRYGGDVVPAPLKRVDTHIDPIAWRGDRSLAGEDALLAMVEMAAAQSGPIGLLTHHAVHTEAVDGFVARFVSLVSAHPGALWSDARALWPRTDGEAR